MSKNIHISDSNIIHTRFRPGALPRAWTALRSWNNRRMAIRELSAMPDALLRDIGIERFQIKDAVNGAYPEIFKLRHPSPAPAPVAEVKKSVKPLF